MEEIISEIGEVILEGIAEGAVLAMFIVALNVATAF